MSTSQDRCRLLVADDDQLALHIFEKTLAHRGDGPSGHELVLCRQAEEAVGRVEEAVTEGRPLAVAFLDVVMPPGPDGVWAAERIRALDPEVNIILVTSMTDVEPEEIARRIPPPDKLLYVQKPVDPLEVRSLVAAFTAKWWAERLLAESRRDLERRVAARTAELGALTVELQRDIERRLKVEGALRRSEAGLTRAQRMAHLGSWECDLGSGALTLSEEMVRLLDLDGRAPPAVIEELLDRLDDDGARSLRDWLHDPARAATYVADHRLAQNDGDALVVHHLVEVVSDGEGRVRGLSGAMMDITELKRSEEQIVYQAYHDMLTGLPNRRLFNDRLQIAMAHARRTRTRTAVLFMDLDDFKTVNDSLGHGVGDELLRAVSRRLVDCIREENTIARVGGDEFLALIQGVDSPGDAVLVAKRLIEALAEPFRLDSHELYIGASIGITLFPDDADGAAELIANADIAMYRAKAHGRNSYKLFTPAMNVMVMERLVLESGLRQAIQREEFVLHYQPIHDLDTRRVVGVEALIRWQHPEEGLVEPDAFLPLAEETGLIAPIGEWVLRTACATVQSWRAGEGLDLLLSVNLSPRQFHLVSLVALVRRVLEETALPPEALILEITEGAVMSNVDNAVVTMEQLTELGVGLSMDDFGRGYSSLSHLRRFPVRSLKIDRSFVGDLFGEASSSTIVESIIAMGHSLDLEVIAEGVETEEQLEFLRAQRCAQLQGFLLGPPAAADEVLARLRG